MLIELPPTPRILQLGPFQIPFNPFQVLNDTVRRFSHSLLLSFLSRSQRVRVFHALISPQCDLPMHRQMILVYRFPPCCSGESAGPWGKSYSSPLPIRTAEHSPVGRQIIAAYQLGLAGLLRTTLQRLWAIFIALIPNPVTSRITMENRAECLPAVTHQQALTLALLKASEDISGRELRAGLSAEGVRMTGPAFYRFMARLEEAGLVVGSYLSSVVVVRGTEHTVRERIYRLSGHGELALKDTREFYMRLPGSAIPIPGV